MDNGSQSPSDRAELVKNSVGALAELMGLFYSELVKGGIPSEWAFELTRIYLIELLEF